MTFFFFIAKKNDKKVHILMLNVVKYLSIGFFVNILKIILKNKKY